MAKVWTYMIIMLGTILLMNLAGLPTGVDYILNFFGLSTNGTTVSTAAFAIAIAALFVISTGSSIVIGFFGGTAPEYAQKAPFAGASLIVLLSTFAAIINYGKTFETWVYYPILFIVGLFSIGFIFALVEWVFGGGD